MNLTSLSIRRPLTLVMAFAAIALMGAMALTQLPIRQLPHVSFPVVQVQTADPGASATSVEHTITNPLQGALGAVSGVTKMVSTSAPGSSQISLQFTGGSNVAADANEVAQIVAKSQASLPSGISPPSISQVDPFAVPIMTVNLSGTLSAGQLYTLANTVVQPGLQRVSGVGLITLAGGKVPDINVVVNPTALSANGLALDSVTTALSAENMNQANGSTTSGSLGYAMETSGAAGTVFQLRRTIVGLDSGAPISLGQVAAISPGFSPVTSTNTLNNQTAVGLTVFAQSGANAVAVDHALRTALTHLDKTLPPGVHVTISGDSTLFTLAALEATATDLGLAILLASVVILAFLQSARQTLIVAVAIPSALFATFLVMDILGFSLDLISLLALSLLIGILVDDAIVVLENITRHFHMGKDGPTAAFDGRMEIGAAAVALTLTDVVVFLPMAFVSGNTGQIFREFGITIAVASLFSLLVSFTLTPMLAARLLTDDSGRLPRGIFGKSLQWVDRAMQELAAWYGKILSRVLQKRGWLLAVGAAALVLTVAYIPLGWLGTAYVPPEDTGLIQVQAQMPPGTTLTAMNAALNRLAQGIRALPGVTAVQTTAGSSNNGAGVANTGTMTVNLVPKTQRPESIFTVETDIRKLGHQIPGLKAAPSVPTPLVNPGSAPIAVILQGPNFSTVVHLAQTVASRLKHVPGLIGVQSQASLAAPEWVLHIRQATAQQDGLTTATIAKAVSTIVQGTTVTTLHQANGVDVSLNVTVPQGSQLTPSQLAHIPIATVGSPAVPVTLGDVATFSASTTPQQIKQFNQLPAENVVAHLKPGEPLGTAAQAVRQAVQKMGLPPGYTFQLGGQVKQQGSAFGPLLGVLGLSVLLIYMLLVALYESFVLPMAVLLALPLASVGALGALVLTGNTLNLFSLIGLIMLMGLVGKNAILLVDYTGTLRKRGMPRGQAIIEAGKTRLRPILMTTMIMVMAMLPLAVSPTSGSEYRSPMAWVLIGGMSSSTLLTLLVVPALYTYLDDVVLWWTRRHQMTRIPPRDRHEAVGG